jgi:endonuclease YncB( thermonuclease family)
MKVKSWQGKAEVLEIIDADTIKVFVDLGFNVFTRLKVRVAGCDAPEINTVPGLAAKNFTQQLLQPGAIITLNSKRLDLYGRAEAIVTLADGRDLSTLLIAAHHAVPATDRGAL